MGGDAAPDAIVDGVVKAAAAGVPVVLVGVEERVRPLLPPQSAIEVWHAADVAPMSGPPTMVRRLPECSVRVAARKVRAREACALVSCGNTGAALVSAILELGVMKGVERPAISTVIPRADGGRLVLLDAGANVDCRPEVLASFALLGAAHAEILGVANPAVGLLSIGEEDGKGNAQVRDALPLLRALPLNVVGNVEPSSAMAGACDVLVCDGFVGNILLKAAEGAVSTVGGILRTEIRRRTGSRLGALLLRGALRRFRHRVAWDAHGGGLLLGTRGVVVIGHGRANADAVSAAVQVAWSAARDELPEAVGRRLSMG